jgi:hypothetical protein
MRTALSLGITLAASWALAIPALAQDKLDLRVLYAGTPDSARTADFMGFLREHFTTVGTTSYTNFRAEEADPYDVVIFDCEIRPQPGRIGLEPRPKLPDTFNRASVMIGGPGTLLAESFKSKIDWL